MFVQLELQVPQNQDFVIGETSRHLLWATTTLYIGAGRKWGINERNNFSHMAYGNLAEWFYILIMLQKGQGWVCVGGGIICFYGLWMCLSKTEELRIGE